jgi:hypothetical protein
LLVVLCSQNFIIYSLIYASARLAELLILLKTRF